MGPKPKETFFDFATDGFQRVEETGGALFLPKLMPRKFPGVNSRELGGKRIRLTLSGA
jgi:hypothetical protein